MGGAQSRSSMPANARSLVRNTSSRTSSTARSGVEAPEVMPIVTGPSGSHPAVVRISWGSLPIPPIMRCSMTLSALLIRLKSSTQ